MQRRAHHRDVPPRSINPFLLVSISMHSHTALKSYNVTSTAETAYIPILISFLVAVRSRHSTNKLEKDKHRLNYLYRTYTATHTVSMAPSHVVPRASEESASPGRRAQTRPSPAVSWQSRLHPKPAKKKKKKNVWVRLVRVKLPCSY